MGNLLICVKNKIKLQNNFLSNFFNEKMKNRSFKYAYQKLTLERQQRIFSYVFLSLKISFFILGTISLLKIGHISKIRIIRLREIKESYLYEKDKYNKLTIRFDDLFSLGGQQRFMKDQDQMINRDRMRVIWR